MMIMTYCIGFPLNIHMPNNNFITLSGAFSSAEHNNGITSTAVFSQSASNRGLITHQGTFADATSNRGLASGVVVFQGSASNDGTVEQAVFLDASRNVGTVTASATFANTSINAGVVQGAAVLIDQSSNTGVLASSVQIGASASNTGTVFGSITPHVQDDGFFAYGYYSGGVRTAPPGYATVAHQVGEIWYTYDASGVASLANGEYDDGTTATFVFVQGVKAAQTGGAVLNGPYSDGYYVDGAIDTSYNNNTSITQAQDDGKYYLYQNGIAIAAAGSWGGTYYAAGEKDTSYNNATPQVDSQDGLSYTFVSGDGTLANGAYSTYYYVNGVAQGNQNYTPQITIDTGEYYYYGVGGTAFKANGAFSIGYFTNGLLDTNYTNTGAHAANDIPTVTYYSYNAGAASLTQGWQNLIGVAENYYFINGVQTNLNSNGENNFNTTDGTYDTWQGLFYYTGAIPYTGPAYWAPDEYENYTMRTDFVDGVETYSGPNV
jgi:hypothetical protein